MDKIPNRPNPLPDSSQPVKDNIKKGKLGSKQVAHTNSGSHLKENSPQTKGQSLNNRQITSSKLQVMVNLGKQKQWQALAAAITDDGNSLDNLTSTMDTLKKNRIELPKEIQTQAGQLFVELAASSVSTDLTSSLSGSLLEDHAVLGMIAPAPHKDDSAIGTVTRMKINKFLEQYQLNDVDPKGLVKDMSARVHSLIIEQIESLEQSLLRTTEDPNIIKQINYSQNERRIEKKYRRESLEP